MSGRILIAAAGLTLVLTSGCAKWCTEQADRQVYTIIAEKNTKALGRTRAFTINPPADLSNLLKPPTEKSKEDGASAPAASTPESAVPPPAPGTGESPAAPAPSAGVATDSGNIPPPLPEPSPSAARLSMADAMRIAVRASREYQTQKETVYLAALVLTFERYVFQPHPTLVGNPIFTDKDTNDPNMRRTRQWDETAALGVSQQLADGMMVVGSLGLVALKFLNKELADAVDSTLSFNVTQPLWRGAGRQVVQENLTQAERNAVYAVRTFARFEQTFAVNIAAEYLRVLQQRDIVMNEYQNYRSLVENRERAEWLAKAERLPEFQVDQARQDELRAYNRWVVTRETYENTLDEFKILLGLPVAREIALDPQEMDRLAALGLQHPDIGLADATAMALGKRFDLMNVRGGLEDAQRKVLVAENGLAGQVDLVASIGYSSRDDSAQSARLAFHRGDYSLGLKIDLPVDRLTERNALRRTQVLREQARRAVDLLQDNVILDVSRVFRRLEQARESYENQKLSVRLAERRVDSTQLLLQAGRASQRDVLESQRALVEARNALTSALVDHTVAGLEFQRDVGTLVVNEEGQIHGWHLTDNGR